MSSCAAPPVADLLEPQVPGVPAAGDGRIRKLGPIDLTRAVLSYLWAAITPRGREDTFEEWVVNRFGRWLFNQYFKSYTEKVWGVSTSEIRSEWAAQRIKGLSFFAAAWSAFFGNRGNKITSLISPSTTRATGRGRCGSGCGTRFGPTAERSGWTPR